MTGLRWTPEEFEAVLKRGNVKIVGARVIRRMDGEPETKHANKPVAKAKAGNAATVTKMAKKWGYEDTLAAQLREAGIHRFVQEYQFVEGRKFRADIAFCLEKIAVEVQGQCHRIRSKFDRDIERTQVAFLAGWRILPIAPKQVKDGTALALIKEALSK
jgi:very-short-patch-repair endonuclease